MWITILCSICKNKTKFIKQECHYTILLKILHLLNEDIEIWILYLKISARLTHNLTRFGVLNSLQHTGKVLFSNKRTMMHEFILVFKLLLYIKRIDSLFQRDSLNWKTFKKAFQKQITISTKTTLQIYITWYFWHVLCRQKAGAAVLVDFFLIILVYKYMYYLHLLCNFTYTHRYTESHTYIHEYINISLTRWYVMGYSPYIQFNVCVIYFQQSYH